MSCNCANTTMTKADAIQQQPWSVFVGETAALPPIKLFYKQDGVVVVPFPLTLDDATVTVTACTDIDNPLPLNPVLVSYSDIVMPDLVTVSGIQVLLTPSPLLEAGQYRIDLCLEFDNGWVKLLPLFLRVINPACVSFSSC